MFDLHMHSLLSDGELLPAELARRYEEKGYKAIAITDHVDLSNLKSVTAAIVEFCHHWPVGRIRVIPGLELTHLPLEQFPEAVSFARKNGIRWVVAHGETLVEPVLPGTLRAAIEAGVDLVSHPGLIRAEEAELAARKGVSLELSARKGHCLTNGLVAQMAVKYGAKMCINSDAHAPGDILRRDELMSVGLGAGLTQAQLTDIQRDMESLVQKIL
ncbi:MAG: histidinol phosphate phosphatase domain-containing protein [Candidatus Omnitrophica bacterium]|nr:histidinol phosphate phosphatase domain-containing protein [Candidatus Omnitrophota bacterium]MDD5574806.1 histidinol phosphate phosphatase domain-containing protein [Candidatus Omnitrophota bacterium]